MPTVRLTVEQKRWREEDDVRTLANAEKIKADSSRMSAAKKRAKIMADEAEKEANAVRNVASGNVGNKKGGGKKKGSTKKVSKRVKR